MSGFAINHIVLSGNLTRDPELKALASGASVCSLRIANNTRRKNGSTGEWEDKPNYFDVTVWTGLGEWVASNIAKGARVVVAGRIEWREWQAEDGSKRQAYTVIADSIVPMGEGNGQGSQQTRMDVPADTDGLTVEEAKQAVAAAKSGNPDDDIPFRSLPIREREARCRDLFVGDQWLA